MKLIVEPSIYLVGRQMLDASGMEQFLADHDVPGWTTDAPSAAETLAEMAGRLCYLSFAKPRPGGNAAYLGHIKEVGHGSVLEHAAWSFIIAGVSRSFTHELVRHRVGLSYSQLSQRYVDESDTAFVVPPSLLTAYDKWRIWDRRRANGEDPAPGFDAMMFDDWRWSVGQARQYYAILSEKLEDRFANVPDKTLRRKMAREAARSVLPNATETKIFVTGNARSIRHFVDLRANEHADAEIRAVAVKLLEVLQKEAPNLFGDYTVENHPVAGKVAETPYRKV